LFRNPSKSHRKQLYITGEKMEKVSLNSQQIHAINTEITDNATTSSANNSKYFEQIPIDKINYILYKHSLHILNNSGEELTISDLPKDDEKTIFLPLQAVEGELSDEIKGELGLVLSWYKMPSGNFEVNAYIPNVVMVQHSDQTIKMDSYKKKKLNAIFSKKACTTNRYFDLIPISLIDTILSIYDYSLDTSNVFISGEEGSVNIPVIDKNNLIVDNTELRITWHKMASGKYEINTYLT
jgi:hypothetical protein